MENQKLIVSEDMVKIIKEFQVAIELLGCEISFSERPNIGNIIKCVIEYNGKNISVFNIDRNNEADTESRFKRVYDSCKILVDDINEGNIQTKTWKDISKEKLESDMDYIGNSLRDTHWQAINALKNGDLDGFHSLRRVAEAESVALVKITDRYISEVIDNVRTN